MGKVRTKTVKKASRVIIEKYYPRLTLDFHINKKICQEVAEISSKRMRNKIAGFVTHLMKRIEKGPVRGISFKLQEEERERRDNYVPEKSEVNTEKIRVDKDTKAMLAAIGMGSITVELIDTRTRSQHVAAKATAVAAAEAANQLRAKQRASGQRQPGGPAAAGPAGPRVPRPPRAVMGGAAVGTGVGGMVMGGARGRGVRPPRIVMSSAPQTQQQPRGPRQPMMMMGGRPPMMMMQPAVGMAPMGVMQPMMGH
ncbi:ribosomal protein S17e [Pelomyxa schiedti]|nr:ribosomal protein S17e [Pelomyxa schiedti]